MRAFREDYPQAELILLYHGHERLKENGVLCLPVETFFKRLNPAKPL